MVCILDQNESVLLLRDMQASTQLFPYLLGVCLFPFLHLAFFTQLPLFFLPLDS